MGTDRPGGTLEPSLDPRGPLHRPFGAAVMSRDASRKTAELDLREAGGGYLLCEEQYRPVRRTHSGAN